MLRRIVTCLLAAGLGVCAWAAAAQDVRPVPPLTGARVIDQAGFLNATQRAALEAKLQALEDETGAQVAVLTVPTTQPEDIADYAQRVGEAWRLGRKGIGDGTIVVVARDDRRSHIQVAKALQGAIPDLAAHRILVDLLAPAIRAGEPAAGLSAVVEALAVRIKQEALPGAKTPSQAERLGVEVFSVFMFVLVPVLAALLVRLFGRRLGILATAGGTGALAWFFAGNLGVAAAAAGLGFVVALVVGAALGLRSYGPQGLSSRRSFSRYDGPIVFGTGGGWGGSAWGGDGHPGGFTSGGGGDFDGGGASGDW